MAAAPLTPTFTLLAVGPVDLLPGLATVAAALAGNLAGLHARRACRAYLAVMVPALLVMALLPWWVAAMAIPPLAAATACTPRRPIRQRAPLPVSTRFLIGSGSVAAALLVQQAAPSLTAYVALLPILYTAGVIATQADQGLLRSGSGAALGVAAFAVVAVEGLALAWIAYVGVGVLAAWAWNARFITPNAQLPS